MESTCISLDHHGYHQISFPSSMQASFQCLWLQDSSKELHSIFIKSSRSEPPWLLMSTISPDLMKPTSIPSIFFYLPLQNASSICWKPIDEVTPQLEACEPETHFTTTIHTSQQVYNCDHAPPINNMGSNSDLIIDSNF